ncbi:MAG: hypothetical protein NVS2B4_03140 [Ramlibacter sp.]
MSAKNRKALLVLGATAALLTGCAGYVTQRPAYYPGLPVYYAAPLGAYDAAVPYAPDYGYPYYAYPAPYFAPYPGGYYPGASFGYNLRYYGGVQRSSEEQRGYFHGRPHPASPPPVAPAARATPAPGAPLFHGRVPIQRP